MAKQKRGKRRLIVISGVAAAGTGAAAAARAQRKRTGEVANQSAEHPSESRAHRFANGVRSALHAGKEKAATAAHKLRHPKGTSTA